MHNMVAEVGFFIALHQIIVEMCTKHSFASKLALWATPLTKTTVQVVFVSLTQNLTDACAFI